MFCTNCGNEIENDIKYCRYCGKSFPNEGKGDGFVNTGSENIASYALNGDSRVTVESQKKSTKKKVAIIVAGVIAIIAIILTIALVNNSALSDDEVLAYENCTYFKNTIMNNPSSFKLYDDEFFLLKHIQDNGEIEYIYTIFMYGVSNSYGEITTNQAVFIDDKYIMDYAEDTDEDDEYLTKLIAKIAIRLYLFKNVDTNEWEKVYVNVKKIKNKMGLE